MNYDEEIEKYTKMIEENANNSDAYNDRGTAYYNKREYDKAIADYSKAIELKLDYAINNRGNAYYGKGEYDKAIADYSKAIELEPDQVEAYNNRGATYNSKGEYDKAIADYSKAIEMKPDYTSAYNGRGATYNSKGEYDKAIADYSKAIELKPDYASAYNNRGNAYKGKGEYDKAIVDYSKAIELNPDNAKYYSNRGNIYDNKGEYDKAIMDYEKVLSFGVDANGKTKNGKDSKDYEKWIAEAKEKKAKAEAEKTKAETGEVPKSDTEEQLKQEISKLKALLEERQKQLEEAKKQSEERQKLLEERQNQLEEKQKLLEKTSKELEEVKKQSDERQKQIDETQKREKIALEELEGVKEKLTHMKSVSEADSFALIIGNAAYKEKQLVSAQKDAEKLAKAFLQYKGYKTKCLINPTKDEISKAVESFYDIMELPHMRRGIIYAAGHGSVAENSEKEREESISTIGGDKCFVSEFIRPHKTLKGCKQIYCIMECCRKDAKAENRYKTINMPADRTVAYATQYGNFAYATDSAYFSKEIISLLNNRDYMSAINHDIGKLLNRAAEKTPSERERPQVISGGGEKSGFNTGSVIDAASIFF